MEQYDLPEGWMWKELGEIVEIGAEQVLPWHEPYQLFNYVALENIEQGTGKLVGFLPTPGAEIKSNKFRFTPEHVLYGKLRPYLRKAFAPDFEGVSATDLLPLKPNTSFLNRQFLMWWLLSPQVLEYVVAKQTGVKMPRLRTGDLVRMPVPIAPLSEQQRIVARTEALFRQSRAAREALERIPPLLNRFRQAALAAAFRGDLVPQDPADEPAAAILGRIQARQRQASTPPDTTVLPELPAGWAWTVLGALAEIRNGVTKGRDLSRFKTVEVPYLRVANVQSGYLDLSIVKNIKIKESELDQYKLQNNDVLFTEGGDRDKLGRGTVWRGEINPCIHQNHIFCARLYTSDVLPEWVSLASQLPYAREYFWSTASQTVNLASTNSTNLRAFPLPLPPSNEQRRIVARIQEFFARAEAVEAAVAIARRRLDKLDQAILARAFRGELVPQSQ